MDPLQALRTLGIYGPQTVSNTVYLSENFCIYSTQVNCVLNCEFTMSNFVKYSEI